MTAVLRLETINFSTMKRGSVEVKGINDGGMIALMKHNNRNEIDKTYEVKSKRDTAIDIDRSKYNLTFKEMTYKKIKNLQNIPHRNNQAGAFQMVFDFQDLDELEQQKFYDADYSKNKAKLILSFLNEQSILDRFELLELVLHNDEKNPHFHLTFSGFDKILNNWGVNEFFRPVVDYVQQYKNNKPVYKKIDKGKDKGKFLLDENGNKIIKTMPIRQSNLQLFQDNWNDFLIKNNQPYRNKKDITSLLQFKKSIWRRFSEETKQKVYLLRNKEKELLKAKRMNDIKAYHKLLNEISPIQKFVINEAVNIEKNFLNFKNHK